MAGTWAKGTTLSIGGTLVGELSDIGGPSRSRDTIDVSSHDSANGFREFVGGMRDGGDVSLEGLYTNEVGQKALNTNYEGNVAQTIIITFPMTPTVTCTFSGIVTAIGNTAPYEDKLGFSATIKVSGKPVITEAVSNNLSALTGIQQEAGGALTFIPVFAGGTYTYVTSVVTTSTWIKLTPTAALGVITVQGAIVTSATQSGEIPLGGAGSLTEVKVIVTESGKAPKTYTITVARA